jgi:DNA (cytosine-5)-methyltransferase 1
MIRSLRPDFFLIENVAGLHRFQKHREFLDSQVSYLRKSGPYVVDFTVLNALNLGIPQHRERLFVVGCRKAIADRAVGHKLLWSSCGWFPWPHLPEYAGAKQLNWPKTITFGSKPPQPKHIPLELTVYPCLLGNGDPEKLPNGQEFFNSYSEKFWQRAEGDVSAKSFKRLHRYRYSPTAWYGNQEVHLHPWKPRRLSVREALRIQSVPDHYVLPKEFSLCAKFKMVCNGVPCRMAELVGIELRNFIARGIERS